MEVARVEADLATAHAIRQHLWTEICDNDKYELLAATPLLEPLVANMFPHDCLRTRVLSLRKGDLFWCSIYRDATPGTMCVAKHVRRTFVVYAWARPDVEKATREHAFRICPAKPIKYDERYRGIIYCSDEVSPPVVLTPYGIEFELSAIDLVNIHMMAKDPPHATAQRLYIRCCQPFLQDPSDFDQPHDARMFPTCRHCGIDCEKETAEALMQKPK